jgi:glycosyltransferase involved in cell wall biosynthesis
MFLLYQTSQKAMKTVLFLTDVTLAGGVDTYTVGLAILAAQRNWRVIVVVETISQSAIRLHLAPPIAVVEGPLYSKVHSEESISLFLQNCFKSFKPDVVHIICGSPRSALSARKEVLERKIPLVTTEQWVPDQPNYDEIEREKIIQTYLQAYAVIHVSDEGAMKMTSWLGIDSNPSVQTIFNGIDLNFWQIALDAISWRREKLSARLQKKERLRLLSLGRLSAQKGIDILIKALGSLDAAALNAIQLDIYGEGPDLTLLQQLVIDYDLASVVFFNSWSTDIISLFSSYDLFLFPSRSEGLPFTLLEALATGIPVIASDIPVHQHITQKGELARLFQASSIESLAYQLKAWLKEPLKDLSSSRYEALLAHFHTHYNQTANLEKTLTILNHAAIS